MRKLAALFFLLAWIVAAPTEARQRAVGRTDDKNLTTEQWLKKHAIAFETPEPRNGFDDLARLSTIVRDARVVSLGEATHGTREFFQMKHRILEFLVERMGFTIFAIEAALPECDAINDYVLHGIGDSGAALAGQHFWTWNTEEVLDMIHWMRDYNLRRGDKPPVQFRGYDMQFSEVAMQNVTAYLNGIDPAGANAITSQWSCFAPFALNQRTYRNESSSFRKSCATNIGKAYSTFASRRDEYVAKSSAAEYEQMLRYIRVIAQHEALVTMTPSVASSAHRDAMMAENVVWLANVAHPGEKLVLWAHNYHVGMIDPITMGTALRRTFPGEEMVIFGFAFDHGAFNSRTLPQGGPPVPHTLPSLNYEADIVFRSVGVPHWIVDMRNVQSTEAHRFFFGPTMRRIYQVGAGFNPSLAPESWAPFIVLRDVYDALIWFENTTPSILR